jgi:hypothetical protein
MAKTFSGWSDIIFFTQRPECLELIFYLCELLLATCCATRTSGWSKQPKTLLGKARSLEIQRLEGIAED